LLPLTAVAMDMAPDSSTGMAPLALDELPAVVQLLLLLSASRQQMGEALALEARS